MTFEPVLKASQRFCSLFFRPNVQQYSVYSGKPGYLPRARSPRSFGQRRNIMAAMAASASSGFSSGVVKVLVSFYRSGEDSAFERHRSRVTFDLSKQSSVAAVKKHLREFLGLNELALKFGMADFELKLFRLQRSSNGKTENYSIT